MTTESEIKLARYSTVEREEDAFGRLIGVRRLKPSELAKATGMTEDLGGSEEMPERDENGNLTGNTITIPSRLPLQVAAAVCEIDQIKIPFPRNRGELDAIYDRLDKEGMDAASKAFVRLMQSDAQVDQKEEAKN